MKVLLYITGHRHLEEYNLFNLFLKNLQINNICDIYIYCNNKSIHPDIIKYYHNFEQQNKNLLITSLNCGHKNGGVEAVSVGIEMGIFKDYDYVIHLHPDVFITDDLYLREVLLENLDNDIVFFITKSLQIERFFSFDFFIFKPKLLRKNIFIEELYSFIDCPEYYLHDMIIKNNIKYAFIKRFNNDTWCPRRIDDNLKLYHEHDLNLVKSLLKETKCDKNVNQIVIGGSSLAVKHITLHKSFNNPKFKLAPHPYQDEFNFEIDNNILIVKRIDALSGWWYNHSVEIIEG